MTFFQVFLENENAGAQMTAASLAKKQKTRRRKIFILKIVAAVSFLILLVIAGAFIYWALKQHFDEEYSTITPGVVLYSQLFAYIFFICIYFLLHIFCNSLILL